MIAHQPGSTPIDIPETVPNPAYTPRPAPEPAPERGPTKAPEKVPEKQSHDLPRRDGVSFRNLPIGAEMQPKWQERCGVARDQPPPPPLASSAPCSSAPWGYTYDREEIKVIDGQVVRVPVREHVPPDYNSIRLWLCNRAPGRWKDISHLHAGVDEDNPLAAWFKQFEGMAMRPKPRELPQPDPIEADYEVVAPPPRPTEDA